MENSSAPQAARRTACAFRGMCSRSPPSSAPSTPRRSRWPCASISSRPTPGPASWWRTSARAPAQRRWPPSTRAAASSVLKPSRPTMPPPVNASAWRARRWRLGRKEFDYRKYSVIYADPPWRYSAKNVQGAAEKHYPTMGIDELCTLPVADLAAPDSVLFLWATFPQLPEALRLIKAWGFTYKSVAFVWLKKNRKSEGWFYGLGFWTRGNAESACWQRGDTQSGRRQTSTSLSFPPSRSTAASRRRPVIRSWPSWAMCPGWSCLQDSPRPAGTCGGTRWKAPSRTSGQSVQRWPGRKGVSKNSLCKCPQRLIQNQDQTCL